MTWPAPISPPAPLRASDADRDLSLDQLRDHWLAGRLNLEEYEERCDEVNEARYLHELGHAARELPWPPPVARPIPPRPNSGALASLLLAVTALGMLAMTMGFAFMMTLPMSVAAWVMGQNARRKGSVDRRQMARAGEVLGIVGTVIAVGMMTVLAMIFGAF